MTACVNKHTKRVAAVVTASLVGALSLGVAAPAFANDGVSLLTATGVDQVENATVVEAKTNDGKYVDPDAAAHLHLGQQAPLRYPHQDHEP